MTKLRFSMVRLLALAALVLAPSSWAQNGRPLLEQVAKAYGVDSFGQIEAVRYTWNAAFPGVNVAHAWTWEPKTDKISYEGKDKEGKPVKATFVLTKLNGEPENVKSEIAPSFVNDNYWLIFPYHAYWDKSATVTDQGMKKLPIGAGSAELVSVKYPAEAGGYTPGDTWDLYVGPDKLVKEFVYHRGGPRKPSLVIASWAGYKKAGPLLVSTDHRGTADGKPLHIFITNLAVKVTGSDAWVTAK